MNILYLHGFRSGPECDKARITRSFFPKHKFHSLSYSPHLPLLACNQIIQFFENKNANQWLVIGSSLGGFWARWAASEIGVKALLINPSIHPDLTLNAVGEFELFDGVEHNGAGRTIQVTQNDLDAFAEFKVNANNARTIDCTVWIATDDEVVDSQQTFDELNTIHKVIKFESGGHRFGQYSELKDEIESLFGRAE